MINETTPSTGFRQVEVLLPLNVAHGFDYLVADDLPLERGMFVTVPFGRGKMTGIIWNEESAHIPRAKCRPITQLHHDLPCLTKIMLSFLDWVSWYNYEAPGMILKLIMPVEEAITTPSESILYSLAESVDSLQVKRTKARGRILEYLEQFPSAQAMDILNETGVSRSVLAGLVEAGAVTRYSVTESLQAPSLHAMQAPELSEKQLTAATALSHYAKDGFTVSALEGLTGSGKTEVYFDTIELMLRANKQVLVLVPEIALSIQWVARFTKRFGFAPDVWHSGVSKGTRKQCWRSVIHGTSRVVVGARSALFLPYASLGLIVVDEEHEPSYKQEEKTLYHARDMAVARAKHEDIPVMLVSATPSLETRHNWMEGRYKHVHLDARFGEAGVPEPSLIDMRQEKLPAAEFLSATLCEHVRDTIAQNKQTLLFLNRRGYAPLILCRSCGHRMECPHCTSWLVLHQQRKQLQCHHCDFRIPMPPQCPSCEKPDTLAACGPGVERIEEEALTKFPDARILTLASDAGQGREQLNRVLTDIAEGNVDIIIGTQLLAKGHHFPLLTLVGIVDADMGLKGGDLRAAERCYQLLHQLAGRAGREKHPGRVMIQTYQPQHPVMRALGEGDDVAFLEQEMQARRLAEMPPFGRLAAIILESKNETSVRQSAMQLARISPAWQGVLVLGPAQAPLYKLRDYFRYRFLVHAPKHVTLQTYISEWLTNVSFPSTLRCRVDIDPQSFL